MKRVANDDIDEPRLRACSRSRSGIDSSGKRSDITPIPTLYRDVGESATAVLTYEFVRSFQLNEEKCCVVAYCRKKS